MNEFSRQHKYRILWVLSILKMTKINYYRIDKIEISVKMIWYRPSRSLNFQFLLKLHKSQDEQLVVRVLKLNKRDKIANQSQLLSVQPEEHVIKKIQLATFIIRQEQIVNRHSHFHLHLSSLSNLWKVKQVNFLRRRIAYYRLNR